MDSPLSRAWQALTRYPVLVLLPIAWDLVAAGLLWLLGNEPARETGRKFNVQFLLPPDLPTGTELLGAGPNLMGFSAVGMLLAVAVAVATAFVTAGFLHLLAGVLAEIPPTWDRFVEGLNRFGGRLLLWGLILMTFIVVGVFFATALGPVAILLAIIGLVAAVLLYLVPFLIVLEDMSVGEAVSHAPSRLMSEFADLFTVALTSVLLSAGLSLFLSLINLRTMWLASPLWAFFGTYLALGVVAIVRPPVPASDS